MQYLGEDGWHLLQNHSVMKGSKMAAGMDKEKEKGWRLGFKEEKESSTVSFVSHPLSAARQKKKKNSPICLFSSILPLLTFYKQIKKDPIAVQTLGPSEPISSLLFPHPHPLIASRPRPRALRLGNIHCPRNEDHHLESLTGSLDICRVIGPCPQTIQSCTYI